MFTKKRPVIAMDIKLKHYCDPETGDVVGVDRYETAFAYRDRYELLNRYVDAIYEAGGIPLMVPCFPDEDILRDYVAMADAFLFVGINDYPPALYREPIRQAAVKDTEGYKRHAASDMIVARLVLQENAHMPALGICAGPELFNIALGGKLVQHLATAEDHIAHSPIRDKYHEIEIRGGRILTRLFGKSRVSVNTNHHQAAHPDFIGEGLEPVAFTDDGVIEALEGTEERFLLGVQWHPERIRDAEHRQKVFGAFLEAAREYRKSKD